MKNAFEPSLIGVMLTILLLGDTVIAQKGIRPCFTSYGYKNGKCTLHTCKMHCYKKYKDAVGTCIPADKGQTRCQCTHHCPP
ncbi:hypothetical protein HID58_005116 [Brassica napus]|uniref:Uncharacterized protein n=2 Tax=Brassica TaxID=3705 RepID=A0ABQ8E7Q6_BRANA|nr:hypothetical protein HID58_005116 [Brassica napus]CAG7892525.1 unnamed protein product [Brassica rapa]VDC86932.1 unnamed protein product [Brassica rapa]